MMTYSLKLKSLFTACTLAAIGVFSTSFAITTEHLEKKCADGDIATCASLARQYYTASLRSTDTSVIEQAIKYAKVACERDSQSCYIYGRALEDAYLKGVENPDALDSATADKLILDALSKGIDSGKLTKNEMAQAFFKQATALDRLSQQDQALSKYKKSCSYDFADACFSVAISYYQGIGTHIDKELGDRYAAKSCKLGSSEGCILQNSKDQYFDPTAEIK